MADDFKSLIIVFGVLAVVMTIASGLIWLERRLAGSLAG